jgi:RNA polymerase sigma-70 factor (ECF subfamily)
VLRGARRAKQRIERLAEPPAQEPDPHGEALRAEERAAVRAALAELPERQGKPLLLRYAGLSYAEIAGALDIAPASIGTLLARAERAFLAIYALEGSGIRGRNNHSLRTTSISRPLIPGY